MKFQSYFSQHCFWGKILGALFGFMIGGPVGALFGLLVGNFFDKGLSQHLNRAYWELYTLREAPIYPIFIKSSFAVLGYIAKSEGQVSPEAISFAKMLMEKLRLNSSQIEDAKAQFNLGKSSAFKLESTLQTLKKEALSHPQLLMSFLTIQYQAAMQEGLTTKRLHALNQVFVNLDYAPIHEQQSYYQEAPFSWQNYTHHSKQQSYQSNRPPPQQPKRNTLTLAEAYAILNATPGTPKAAVKQTYRRLISKNHPDKLIAQGLSEAQIKLANEKTQKIRKAYETICEAQGW